MEELEEGYMPTELANLESKAARKVYDGIFSPEGIVVVDPNTKEGKYQLKLIKDMFDYGVKMKYDNTVEPGKLYYWFDDNQNSESVQDIYYLVTTKLYNRIDRDGIDNSNIYEIVKKVVKNILKENTAYHSTNHEISKFVDDFIGGKNAIDAKGPGIYFTDRNDSTQYGGIVYTVNLNSNRFLTDKSTKGLTPALAIQLIKLNKDWQMNASDWDENPNIGLNMFIRETFKSNKTAADRLLNIWGDFYRYNPKEFARNCTQIGIDGINVTNEWGGGGSDEHYIVYNPAIIEILNIQKLN